ncbi:MAG: N-acetylmuramoyl-L-alanine amidase [Candidatus Cloacimonadota bacterium]|nr:N-acetylmuramoyl-L-alanine amidase [Candidatus Cloacimonadota bacterium]
MLQIFRTSGAILLHSLVPEPSPFSRSQSLTTLSFQSASWRMGMSHIWYYLIKFCDFSHNVIDTITPKKNILKNFQSNIIMKKILLTLLFMFQISFVIANEYQVSYVNSARKDYLSEYEFESEIYFDISNLSKIFSGEVIYDFENQTATLVIFNKNCIFNFQNKWVDCEGKNYNLHGDVLVMAGIYFIPKYFLNILSKKLFPKKVALEQNKIVINLSSVKDYLINKIVIDPGHGGKDPGAIGKNLYLCEKDVVLKISKKTKKLLEKNLDVQVLLTRDSDKFVPLWDRTDFANEEGADLFISIHCNANLRSKANGTEVYYLSTAQSDEERAVEAMENKAIKFEDPGSVERYSELDFILYDMRQNEHLFESADLSEICQKNIVSRLETRDRGVKQANFYVLRRAFMPAILIEVAFLSNKWEERKLKSNNFLDRAAQSIYESIVQFKKKYDKM